MYVLVGKKAWKGVVGMENVLVLYIVFNRPCGVRHCRKQGLKSSMGFIDVLVLCIAFAGHVVYVLAENEAWNGVVSHFCCRDNDTALKFIAPF